MNKLSVTESDIDQAIEQLDQVSDQEELENFRLEWLGRKGKITQALRGISDLPKDQRAETGKFLNQAKNKLESAVADTKDQLRREQLQAEIEENFDISLPAPGHKLGHSHPVEDLIMHIIHLFERLGFGVASGPELETQWYNFEALNIPKDHPARDVQDTFYLEQGLVARTHTSPVQVRFMEDNAPPIRIIAPGRVYRNEDEDPTHLWSFHQLEGLVIDQEATLADLKGTLLYLLKGVFGEEAEIRLRPNYFPYVEPGVEADVSCQICAGGGCSTCSQEGWIELLGAGMVHPQVLRNVGIDPDEFQGFAFGVGLDRLAAVKHGVEDLRHFWRPDLKFLKQF